MFLQTPIHTTEHNHQQQGAHNCPPQNQPRNSPLHLTQLFSTPPFCSLQFSPSDQSHYFLRYKARPLAIPARRTSNGDWSLTRVTSSATLNKWAGWFIDPATSGRWGESDSKRSLFPGTALSPRLCRSPNPSPYLKNQSMFRGRRPTRA